MRYDEKEELEATGEWLLRINSAGFSEELTYVPSYLSRVGVAPVDVVDRLDYLRDCDRIESRARLAGAPSSVMVLERPQIIEAEADTILDYDSYGMWEWAGPIEEILEESFRALLTPEPGLYEFNELASLARSAKRTRGKRARSSARPIA